MAASGQSRDILPAESEEQNSEKMCPVISSDAAGGPLCSLSGESEEQNSETMCPVISSEAAGGPPGSLPGACTFDVISRHPCSTDISDVAAEHILSKEPVIGLLVSESNENGGTVKGHENIFEAEPVLEARFERPCDSNVDVLETQESDAFKSGSGVATVSDMNKEDIIDETAEIKKIGMTESGSEGLGQVQSGRDLQSLTAAAAFCDNQNIDAIETGPVLDCASTGPKSTNVGNDSDLVEQSQESPVPVSDNRENDVDLPNLGDENTNLFSNTSDTCTEDKNTVATGADNDDLSSPTITDQNEVPVEEGWPADFTADFPCVEGTPADGWGSLAHDPHITVDPPAGSSDEDFGDFDDASFVTGTAVPQVSAPVTEDIKFEVRPNRGSQCSCYCLAVI
jgi:hypothetical protein